MYFSNGLHLNRVFSFQFVWFCEFMLLKHITTYSMIFYLELCPQIHEDPCTVCSYNFLTFISVLPDFRMLSVVWTATVTQYVYGASCTISSMLSYVNRTDNEVLLSLESSSWNAQVLCQLAADSRDRLRQHRMFWLLYCLAAWLIIGNLVYKMFCVGADETEVIGSREIQLDDDLAMTQTEVNTKCPVTMKEMIKPVRNKHCGHNYDYSGAKQLIRNRQQAR